MKDRYILPTYWVLFIIIPISILLYIFIYFELNIIYLIASIFTLLGISEHGYRKWKNLMSYKDRVYKYLSELRDKYQNEENLFSLPIADSISIEGKIFERSIWSEEYQGNTLIIFRIESKAILGTKNYYLGLEAGNDGALNTLTNEALWELGVP